MFLGDKLQTWKLPMPAALAGSIVALALLSIALLNHTTQVVLAARPTRFQSHADAASVAVREEPQGSCELAWRAVPSPNNASDANLLVGVSALDADDVWAIGYYREHWSLPWRTLTQHWDGTQ